MDWLSKIKEEFGHIEKSKYGQISDGKIRKIETSRSNGEMVGKGNVLSGHMSKIQKIGGSVVGNIAKDNWLPDARIIGGKNSHLVEYTCPHCGYCELGPNIFKKHFDNCVGYLDVFEFNGKVGDLIASYNNQNDILKDYPTMSASVLCNAVNGKKKKHHPNFIAGYVVIPRGINK